MVADQFAATAGKDRRAAGETCSLLLAFSGGRTSNEAALWEYGTSDCLAAAASGVAKKLGTINLAEERRQEPERCLKVSAARAAESGF